MAKDETAILEQFDQRLKLCKEVWQAQRDREKEDLAFQLPERQWDEAARRARMGDMQSTPGRPTLSVSLLDQPINLVTNQMRSSDLGVQFHPVSEDADKDGAEARQGIYRFIERDPETTFAREWAYDRAVKAGMGFYRVLTEYDEEGGQPGDQKIVLRRIFYQDGVYLDPAAQSPDFRDGEYAFLLAWMPVEEFKRQFPKSKLAQTGGDGLSMYYETIPEWVRLREGTKGRDVLVGEYWYKVKRLEKFKVNGEEREREAVEVYCAKVGANELLDEPYRWPGKWIPIIPAIGRELQPMDGQRMWVGMVRPARDGQRAFNFAISSAVERASLEPKAPFVGPAASFEGYEDTWRQANTKNFPYLPYNMGSPANPNPAPQRAQIDAQGTSLNLEIAQMARDNVQAATAVFDPSLGKVPQKDRSGRAIMALQEQAESGTSHFLQNFAKVTLTYEAEVINDLMPAVYNRPERVLRIIRGDDKKVEAIMINAPHVMDQQSGMPMPAPPGAQGAQEYVITRGRYGVSVSIGKSFQTRMQEGAEKIGEFLASQPQYGVALLDIYLRYQDWPGAQEMADRMAKLREMQMPGLSDAKDGKPTIEQLQGALQRGEMQMQQMGQQLQMAVEQIKTDQAKQQAQMMKAQLDAQTAMQKAELEMAKAEMDRDTKLRTSAADNETKLLIANLVEQNKLILETLGLHREAMIAEREAERMDREQEHEVGMAGAQAATAAQESERSREYESEQGEAAREHEAAMAVVKTPAPKEPR